MILKQNAQPKIVHTRVIRNHGQVLRTVFQHCRYEILRDATQSKAADQQFGTVRDIFDCIADTVENFRFFRGRIFA